MQASFSQSEEVFYRSHIKTFVVVVFVVVVVFLLLFFFFFFLVDEGRREYPNYT